MATAPRYAVDPLDPRAPSQELWDSLDPAERDLIVESLPCEFSISEWALPEGDPHMEVKIQVRDVLRRYYRRRGRGVYIGNELPVYYPGEALFAPDVMAVLDVDPHPRDRWVVSAEGKGLDLAMEIHVAGRRSKDVRDNALRYARLGVQEYFVFEVRRSRLLAFRLAEGRGVYVPILPQGGLYPSAVLGLEIAVEGERLRFLHELAPLPDAVELIARLETLTDQLTERREAAERRAEEESRRVQEESRRAEAESRRAEEESRRAEAAERRLAEALAELARLRRGG